MSSEPRIGFRTVDGLQIRYGRGSDCMKVVRGVNGS
jgi:hypothetical protein